MTQLTGRRTQAKRARDPERNSGPTWRILQGICIVTVGWLLFPTLIVIPMSFTSSRSYSFPPDGWSTRWYEQVFASNTWMDAAWNSVWIATVVAIISAVVGTFAAIGLRRAKLPGTSILNVFALAPMIVPAVLLGVGTYLAFLQWGLVNNPWGFIFAHSVLGIPYVVVAALASLTTVDRNLERAAASLGAGPVKVFFGITLRLMLPGILGGALFAFVASFDELIVSLFLVGPNIRTLPVALFSAVTEQSNPSVAAVSVLVLAFTSAILMLIFFVQRKGNR